jgi:acetylornithine/N-succinyldiaminopimelate aminotransferase
VSTQGGDGRGSGDLAGRDLAGRGRETTTPPTSPLMSTYAPVSVTFVRGEGSWLWDTEGRRYLDCLSGIAVTSLGHAHPAVAEALALQSRTLCHVSNLFGNTVGPEVAATLDRLLGGGGQVFFANSGAEANECAIKLVRRWGGQAGHGRTDVVCAYGSFHGRTMATLAATGQPAKHEGFQPLPGGFRHVAYDDMSALEASIDPSVGAVMLEAIQGEFGVRTPGDGYLAEVRRVCDQAGILMVADEVQTGLGRTGQWWGFSHDKVMPDIVTVAKALGNGMPIGACWARAGVAGAFRPGDHGSTFGGQPLAAAAARATLAVMESCDVPALARSAGSRLVEALLRAPGVVSLRGRGLLLGVVLAPGLSARAVTALALERGLVVNAPDDAVIRLAPSLLISEAEVDEAVEILSGALAALAGGCRPG